MANEIEEQETLTPEVEEEADEVEDLDETIVPPLEAKPTEQDVEERSPPPHTVNKEIKSGCS